MLFCDGLVVGKSGVCVHVKISLYSHSCQFVFLLLRVPQYKEEEEEKKSLNKKSRFISNHKNCNWNCQSISYSYNLNATYTGCIKWTVLLGAHTKTDDLRSFRSNFFSEKFIY